MRDYIVLSPVDHDDRHYPIGSPIMLSDELAAPLLLVDSIAKPEIAETRLAQSLLGSDYLPTLIRISRDLTVPQTEIVERAFIASGLDHAGWNGLGDSDREIRIASSLELVRQQNTELAPEGNSIGRAVASAEARRVEIDNASEDPQANAAAEVVFQHSALSGAADGGTIETATIAPGADLGASGDAPAVATVVIDPVEATHTKTATDGKRRRL